MRTFIGMVLFSILTSVSAIAAQPAPTPSKAPATINEIKTALTGLVFQDVAAVQKGAFVSSRISERSPGHPERVLATKTAIVRDVFDFDESVFLTIDMNIREFVNGYPRDFQERRSIEFKKSREVILNIDEDNTEFFNLKVTNEAYPTPSRVLESADCGGIAGACPKTLAATVVKFEMVEYRGPRVERTIFKYVGAPEVPFLASPIMMCRTTIVWDGPREIPVEQCEKIVDFGI